MLEHGPKVPLKSNGDVDWTTIGEFWKQRYRETHVHLASRLTQTEFGIHFCVYPETSFFIKFWAREVDNGGPIRYGDAAYYAEQTP